VPLGEHLVLHPGQFLLGSTLEFIRLPRRLGAQVLSRSSWGRLGLLVATAVIVQPGFAGSLTLELVNTGSVPIRLRPGLRVAQLQVWAADSETAAPYSTGSEKYRAPLGPESNKLAWEADELTRLQAIGRRLLGREQ
jgi:dCTP deaminase